MKEKRARPWKVINPLQTAASKKSKRWQERHPEQYRAGVAARNMKRMRRLTKTGPCSTHDGVKQYARELEQQWRTRAIMFLGGKCEKCGINDSRVLQIDHVAGGGWTGFKKSRTGRGSARNVFAEPSKFQLLCANDNWIKKFEHKEMPGYLAGDPH